MKRLSKFLIAFILAIASILATASGGDWFRFILHAFGVHKWTPWKETVTTPLQALTGVRFQEHQCRICGVFERRQF